MIDQQIFVKNSNLNEYITNYSWRIKGGVPLIQINYSHNDIKEALTTALRLIHGVQYENCESSKSFYDS